MSVLQNFPMVSQTTSVTSDNMPSENALYDCVPASIGAGILWYQGKTQWDQEINPDKLKDSAVGQGYTGGTAAQAYVPFCERLGFVLYSITDTAENLVQHIHQQLQAQHVVIVTVPDNYVSASLGWSHVLAMYGELGTGLLAMDPYPLPGTTVGHTIHNSDSQWASLLRFKQIWVLIKVAQKEGEVPVTITLETSGVAQYFEAAAGGWRCKQTGKTVQGAILAEYCRYGGTGLCGLTWLGLPESNEIPLGPDVVKQHFERGVLAWDPNHTIDNPPGAGAVYPLHLYAGPGQDPMVAVLEGKVAAALKQQQTSALLTDMQQIYTMSGKYKS